MALRAPIREGACALCSARVRLLTRCTWYGHAPSAVHVRASPVWTLKIVEA